MNKWRCCHCHKRIWRWQRGCRTTKSSGDEYYHSVCQAIYNRGYATAKERAKTKPSDYSMVETWPLCRDIDVQMVDAKSCAIRLGDHAVRIEYEWTNVLINAIDSERRQHQCWREGKWLD